MAVTTANSISYVKQRQLSTKFGSNATPLENREKFGQAGLSVSVCLKEEILNEEFTNQ